MTVTDAADPGSEPNTVAGKWAEGLAALRAAHRSLRRSVADAAPDHKRRQIQDFLNEACEAGAFIAGLSDRSDAQNILDYWFNELASLRQSEPNPATGPRGFTPKLLAPFDPTRATRAEQTIGRGEEEQKELIRLSAYARQYVNSDKDRGYLLSGDALKDAARFKDVDKNIALLVERSTIAARHGRYAYFGNFSILVPLLLMFVVIVALYYWITKFTDVITTRTQTSQDTTPARMIFGLIGTKAGAAFDLNLLAWFQPWAQPYDLSGTDFSPFELSGLQLHAPNFAGARFRNVNLPKAKIPAASFSESTFRFDGPEGRNDFSEGDLMRNQFRAADVAFTSFRGSDLYRAVFDRAVLCDVDFEGANLRSASFWGTKFDSKTLDSLKNNAAWWLAVGWRWSEIKRLAPIGENEAAGSPETKTARLSAMKNSPGFQKDLAVPKAAFERSSSGTVERARALNDIAWIYAVWGLCISEPDSQWHSESCTKDLPNDFPRSALEAAQRAVDFITKLNDPPGEKGPYADFLASQQDTLAYILMQSGRKSEAVKVFEDISRTSPVTAESGETSFRHAIALYAVAGNGADGAAQRDNAVKMFEKAVFEDRYQPSHELKTLNKYIFGNAKFERILSRSVTTLWPTAEDLAPRHRPAPGQGTLKEPKCPERKAANAR
jgi:Pentapeptide repeats (8 copies)